METKRTPGPWHTGGHGNTIIYAADGWAVADVKVYHNRHNGYEETQANARLIAAAPELLEACVAMIEWDEREKDHSVDFHARMALCDAAFQKARAAIAKAEGR